MAIPNQYSGLQGRVDRFRSRIIKGTWNEICNPIGSDRTFNEKYYNHPHHRAIVGNSHRGTGKQKVQIISNYHLLKKRWEVPQPLDNSILGGIELQMIRTRFCQVKSFATMSLD